MLPRGLLRFPRSDCFLSRSPSRKGQEAIEGRKLVGLSHGEQAWHTGGSATGRVPNPRQGSLRGEGGRSFPAGRCKPGWEGGGRPPFPSRAGESLTTARELFGRGARCKQTSFTALPAEPGLARLLPPASMGAGCPQDGHVPTGMVSLAGSGQNLGQNKGQRVPEASLGELPGIQGSCKKCLAIARKVL